MYHAYVLKSDSFEVLYKGHTSDLEKRLKAHNEGKSPYTRNKGPWRLVYSESFNTKSEAIKREKFFKSGKGREILNQILEQNRVEE